MTARKSAALKALEGTARPDRALRVAGGVRLTEPPRPPARLRPAAAREWRTLARGYTSAGLLTVNDLPTLRLLCEALADEGEARLAIERDGWTIPGAAGAVKVHPAVRAGQVARTLAARLLVEFGATPAARQRVEALPAAPDPDSPWARMKVLQGGK